LRNGGRAWALGGKSRKKKKFISRNWEKKKPIPTAERIAVFIVRMKGKGSRGERKGEGICSSNLNMRKKKTV